MKKLMMACSAIIMALSAQAANLTDEECEKQLIQAEKNTNTAVYERCGFGDEVKAWDVWAPFVAAHDMKKGIYELCQRYPNHTYGALYCEKALQLNYGPALSHEGFKKIELGQDKEALGYFQKAVKSNDLSQKEILKITETIAHLYLDQKSELYNPQSGVALLKKAALSRSAEANNYMAYLTYTGEHNVALNFDETEKYLWRAILLGCPAAEENLGAFYLVRQKKIPLGEARYYLSLQAKTCEPFDKNIGSEETTCACESVMKKEAFYQKAPYLYIDQLGDELVKLKDKTGQEGVSRLGETLADGSIIKDIRPTLITLEQNGKQIFINRYHEDECVAVCTQKQKEADIRKPIVIKPYHLTFTKGECSEIDYFVKQQKLVDEKLPYVGQKECIGLGMDETTKVLLEK